MLRLLLGHDQVVFKDRWSLNTGGHKDRFHYTTITKNLGRRIILVKVMSDSIFQHSLQFISETTKI